MAPEKALPVAPLVPNQVTIEAVKEVCQGTSPAVRRRRICELFVVYNDQRDTTLRGAGGRDRCGEPPLRAGRCG